MNYNDIKRYDKRYLVSILIEAETPLSISTGEKNLLTDSSIMTDINGLPLILGTSITGVLRHAFEEKEEPECLFGYQLPKSEQEKDQKSIKGQGSRLIISNAHLVGSGGYVYEGLCTFAEEDLIFEKFKKLPVRQHTRIDHKGTSAKHGKFDEQVVFKGTRFRFEIELIGKDSDIEDWEKLINLLKTPDFRLGGGTRKGFGDLRIVEVRQKVFDMYNDLGSYLEKSSSLNRFDLLNSYSLTETKPENWVEYKLSLEPEDLWLFGSGFGDEEVDITPVYEETIKWENDKPFFTGQMILIPATSVKGALSHRVAYHYNKLIGRFADDLTDKDFKKIADDNEAVKMLFGFNKQAKEKDDDRDAEHNNKGARGNVIFSDVFIAAKEESKVLNHLAIDRFTGGALDSALFDEKVIKQKDAITFTILVNTEAVSDEKVLFAFKNALDDICNGMLPLGGGVMKGHGCFKGKWEDNNG